MKLGKSGWIGNEAPEKPVAITVPNAPLEILRKYENKPRYRLITKRRGKGKKN